jgi:cholesterol oxidase
VARIGSWLIDWELEPTKPAHRAVLLGMGRDREAGRYYIDSEGRIQVHFTLDPKAQNYSEQELLMRDLAGQWKAELRVNPTWAAARVPVTVHHQGGCPMADDHKEGVVDGWGKVHGNEGLFVFDGAALPRAVGVNPSSTIAALAERNVEHFLETREGSKGTYALDPNEPEEIRAWQERAKGWDLVPPRGSSLPFESKPIGIAFTEVMTGFHAPAEDTAPATVGPHSGLFAALSIQPRGLGANGGPEVSDNSESYEAAYKLGCPKNTITLTLNGTIKDIAAFDADDDHRLEIDGTVEFSWPEKSINYKGPICGHANFFVPLTFIKYKGPDHIMLYDLAFRDETGAAWHVVGFKRLHEGEGTRAWSDTTNLFVTITCEQRGLRTSGVARLPMEKFLYEVVGKMKVTGTTDPARRAWAVAMYGELLFGHLWDIYMPQMRQSKSFFAGRPLSRRG